MIRAIHLFPTLSQADAIQAFRVTHDPLASKIPLHVTLVFPFESELPNDVLSEHVKNAIGDIPPFEISLEPVARFTPQLIWLAVAHGRSSVQNLHDSLYTNVLARFRDTTFDFDPHVTIGRFSPTHPPQQQQEFSLGDSPRGFVKQVFIEEILTDDSSELIASIDLLPQKAEQGAAANP